MSNPNEIYDVFTNSNIDEYNNQNNYLGNEAVTELLNLDYNNIEQVSFMLDKTINQLTERNKKYVVLARENKALKKHLIEQKKINNYLSNIIKLQKKQVNELSEQIKDYENESDNESDNDTDSSSSSE